MKKIILIFVCAFLLISATVVEVNTMVIQPKVPKSVIVLYGYIYGSNALDLQSALNTYAKIGYVVKLTEYNSSNYYLIVLEKY